MDINTFITVITFILMAMVVLIGITIYYAVERVPQAPASRRQRRKEEPAYSLDNFFDAFFRTRLDLVIGENCERIYPPAEFLQRGEHAPAHSD